MKIQLSRNRLPSKIITKMATSSIIPKKKFIKAFDSHFISSIISGGLYQIQQI